MGSHSYRQNSQPRMPWRDIGIQLRGEIAKYRLDVLLSFKFRQCAADL